MTFSIYNTGILVLSILFHSHPVHTTTSSICNSGKDADGDKAYIQCGDFNLGALISVYDNDRNGRCLRGSIKHRRIQYVEAISYAVDMVNSWSGFLMGYKLGFAVLNDCGGDGAGNAKAMQFLPCERYEDTTSGNCCPQRVPHVVGTIGPLASSQAIILSPLFGHYGIVQISTMATAEALSDKQKYPYFFRTIPPDRYQVNAIIGILQHFHWSYVSVVYENNDYGLTSYIQFRTLIKDLDICTAYIGYVSKLWGPKDFRPVAKGLLGSSKAHVVVAFIFSESARRLLKAIHREDPEARFVWVGSETFDMRAVEGHEHLALGSLHLSLPQVNNRTFQNYLSNLNPLTSKNPWFREFWQSSFKCKWEETDGRNKTDKNCNLHVGRTISDVSGFYHDSTWVYSIIDAVSVFAYALKTAISACAENGVSKDKMYECVHGQTLLNMTRNVSVEGFVQKIEFDSHQDTYGSYVIQQLAQNTKGEYEFHDIGYWDRKTNTVEIQERKLEWYEGEHTEDIHGDIVKPGGMQGDIMTQEMQGDIMKELPLRGMTAYTHNIMHVHRQSRTPQSVCSIQCPPGEETVVDDNNPRCCWSCIPCKSHEYVSNSSRCQECSPFMWPNQNRTDCEPIQPQYLKLNDIIGIILLSLITIGTVFLTSFMIIFIKFREHRIIKASTPKLMLFTLFGLYMTLISCVLFLLEPSKTGCTLLFLLFHLSFTLLYTPLMTRTLRIYRVFSKSARLSTRIKFASETFMFGLVFMAIIGQLMFLAYVMGQEPTDSALSMPDREKPYVVQYCNTGRLVLLLPLAYNMLLLLCCVILGFLTRKLPDNFNESLYIFFSASTTIIVWLAFLPTYFLTRDATYRQLLLPAASLLNVYTMLSGLCFPRVYVVLKSRYKHSQTSLQVSRWRSTSSTMVTSTSNDNMRVTYMRANSTSPAPSHKTSNGTLTSFMRADSTSPLPSHRISTGTLQSQISLASGTSSVYHRMQSQVSVTSGASSGNHRLSQQISQTSSGAPSVSPRLYRQISNSSSTPLISSSSTTGHAAVCTRCSAPLMCTRCSAPLMCNRCSNVISSLTNISSEDNKHCTTKV